MVKQLLCSEKQLFLIGTVFANKIFVNLTTGSDHKIGSIFLFRFRKLGSQSNIGYDAIFFLLSVHLSYLFDGTNGCDLTVLMTTEACRSRVFDNVVLY